MCCVWLCCGVATFFLVVLQMVDYNGGRTLEDLTKFVEEQVSGAGEEEEEEEEEGEGEEEKGEEEEEKPTKKTEL